MQHVAKAWHGWQARNYGEMARQSDPGAERQAQSGGDGRPDSTHAGAGEGNPPGYVSSIQRLGGSAAHYARRVKHDQWQR